MGQERVVDASFPLQLCVNILASGQDEILLSPSMQASTPNDPIFTKRDPDATKLMLDLAKA